MVAGPIIERLGRRYTVGVICALAFTGMTISNAVPSYWGVMAGRIINGVSMVRMNVHKCF
jgi:SP family sugar:H+ symporter-like MFS transporter